MAMADVLISNSIALLVNVKVSNTINSVVHYSWLDMTIQSVCLIAFTFCLSLWINAASAQPKITILYSEIDYMFSQSEHKQGPYNNIADALFYDPNIQTLFVPPSRGEFMWQNKEADCLFPANTNTMDKDSPLLSSLPFNTVRAFIFARHPYSSLSVFENKDIALRRGTTYGGIRSKIKANFIDLNSDEQGIKILEKYRVDALIAYYSDAVGAYNALKIPLHYFNPNLPVYVASEHLVCFDSEANRLLIEQTNNRITTLEKSGKLAQWLLNGKYTN
jgi:ABC-type amino acid transport substrate-binding protein